MKREREILIEEGRDQDIEREKQSLRKRNREENAEEKTRYLLQTALCFKWSKACTIILYIHLTEL